MDIKELQKPLTKEDIEFRVQSVNKGGYVTILAYKNARADMNRLDEVCGALNWKREHTRDNQNCIVSIWDKDKSQWVSKEDTGTESFSDKEKGLASDSFKRACFNWGIGRELYDYPVIQFKLNEDETKTKPDGNLTTSYKFNLKNWSVALEHEGNKVKALALQDTNNNVRFMYGKFTKK